MAPTEQDLHLLYRQLGDLHAQRANFSRAVEAYALAFYYARQMGDESAAHACRQQIARMHPGHVVCTQANPALYFAQLLMRFPVEQAVAERRQLLLSQQAPAASSAPLPMPGSPTLAPPAYAPAGVNPAPTGAESPWATGYSDHGRTSADPWAASQGTSTASSYGRPAAGAAAPFPPPSQPQASYPWATPANPNASDGLFPLESPQQPAWLGNSPPLSGPPHRPTESHSATASTNAGAATPPTETSLAASKAPGEPESTATSPAGSMLNLAAAFVAAVGFIAAGFAVTELWPAFQKARQQQIAKPEETGQPVDPAVVQASASSEDRDPWATPTVQPATHTASHPGSFAPEAILANPPRPADPAAPLGRPAGNPAPSPPAGWLGPQAGAETSPALRPKPATLPPNWNSGS